MSVSNYSNNVKRQFIQPIFDSANFRSEFRFDGLQGQVILPSLQLINHGSVGNIAHSYLRNIGVMGLIKSITLFDGNVKLTGLNQVPQYSSFKKFNRTNNASKNIDQYTDLNGLGCDVSGKSTKQGTSTDIEKGLQVIQQQLQNTINTTEATTKQGQLNLNEYLSMLRNIPCLPLSVLKNLRLVVDYNSNSAFYSRATNMTSCNTVQPLLAVDVVTNSELANSMVQLLLNQGGVRWNEIEHDQNLHDGSSVSVPTGVNTSEDKQTHTFHGFDNKRVNKIVVVKEPLEATTWNESTNVNKPYANTSSLSFFREKMQVRVNGSNVLARQGIEGHNEALGYLVDTYGDFVAPTGTVQSQITNMGDLVTDANSRAERDVMSDYKNIKGFQGYMGIDLSGVPVNEFQLDVERPKCNSTCTQQNQNFNIHVFAEVPKAFVVSDGKYNVAYA